jgi:uncharacterized membrane protein
MNTLRQSSITPTVLSGALVVSGALWSVAAYVFQVTNRQSKDGVFGAPLWALVLVALVPLSTVVIAPLLLRARHRAKERLRPFDYLALAVGAAPFAFVGGIYLVAFLTR